MKKERLTQHAQQNKSLPKFVSIKEHPARYAPLVFKLRIINESGRPQSSFTKVSSSWDKDLIRGEVKGQEEA